MWDLMFRFFCDVVVFVLLESLSGFGVFTLYHVIIVFILIQGKGKANFPGDAPYIFQFYLTISDGDCNGLQWLLIGCICIWCEIIRTVHHE